MRASVAHRLMSMKTLFAIAAQALCAACLAAPLAGQGAPADTKVVQIKVLQTAAGKTLFDPVGVHIAVGTTVRWVQMSGYHSVTAYHPKNDKHELRIPESAQPWDSDILLGEYPAPGSTFEHVFTVQGVYDYFCKPHEMAGMVGRIVVGEPGTGPGTRPFGWAEDAQSKLVPAAAQAVFPSIAEIMSKGVVHAP